MSDLYVYIFLARNILDIFRWSEAMHSARKKRKIASFHTRVTQVFLPEDEYIAKELICIRIETNVRDTEGAETKMEQLLIRD